MKKALLFSLAMGFSICSVTASAETCESMTEKAHVSAVYPTADTLPENLLRFYIYFSKPMQREAILSSVYLTDDEGKKLEGVFLDNRFDLWSPDSTRLTLLFDPGRVKTGLVAHNSMGRALKPGSDYQLVIDLSARDAEGCTMAEGYTKTFTASAADHKTPDPEHWSVSHPQQGTREALRIDLDDKIDHVSLAYRIRIKNEAGHIIAGSIDLDRHERQWIFLPAKPWSKEAYHLAIDPVLEDVAGNRVTGLFDQPSLAEESMGQQQWISIPLSFKKQ